MKIIILAGGGGSRLFPLSRTCYPKQFLELGGQQSLLIQTIQRFLPIVKSSDIVIITNHEYLHHVKAELACCNVLDVHIVLEPVGRNTAPAIALAARYCLDVLGVDEREVLFVTPSDHIIQNEQIFIEAVKKAASVSEDDKLVTFGITPQQPETGYGYIQAGEAIDRAYRVAAFKEKPDLATAEQYVAAGNYFWNSGMFAFSIACIMNEFSQHQPAIFERISGTYQQLLDQFAVMPSISIDYAVVEKSCNVVMIPLTSYWNDIGSWDAIYDVLPKDGNGNAVQGDCLALDCSNTLMLGRSRLIAGIGLDDLLVVETDDVILVAQKGESQKVKDVVETLKLQGRKEAHESTTMYRPWGSYTILGEGPGYKLKKIVVSPGQRLSLQLHYHRSEHWIVTGGTAIVTIGENEQMIHEGESIFVPQSTKHRLENPGRIALEMIEVQNGSYLEEDDIVRFDDIYGRS